MVNYFSRFVPGNLYNVPVPTRKEAKDTQKQEVSFRCRGQGKRDRQDAWLGALNESRYWTLGIAEGFFWTCASGQSPLLIAMDACACLAHPGMTGCVLPA